MKNNKCIEEVFPEHEFVASCLRIGLTITDLKELTYVDVMKILYSFLEKNKKEYNKTTQADIDKFLM